jgi:hypothetical protein
MSIPNKHQKFKDFEVVYADSMEAINLISAQGLPKNCIIKTLSPYIIFSKRKNVINIDKEVKKEIYDYIIDYSQDLILAIVHEAEKVFKDECLSRAIGMEVFNYLKIVMRAASLKETDYSLKTCIINAESASLQVNQNIKNPWDMLLKSNDHAKAFNIQVPLNDEPSYNFNESKNTYLRFKGASIEKIIYKLGIAFWKIIPKKLSSSHIMMQSSNDYAKEAVCKFLLKGWRLDNIKIKKTIKTDKLFYESAIDKLLEKTFKPFTEKICCKSATEATIKNLKSNLMIELLNYFDAQKQMRVYLENNNSYKRKMVFLGHKKDFVNAAISNCSRAKNIPVVLFQHGIDKEIAERLEKQRICDETVLADTFISYNSTQKKRIENNPFAITNAKCIVGAGPKEYFNYNKKKFSINKILYVNTLLYRGYKQTRFDYLSDSELASHEIYIIKNVLSKIPHEIVYKCYPSVRYIDKDPIKEEIKKHKNISLFDKNIDGRYIYSDYRVIMTSRASSTFGWVLASKRPVIYIDPIDNNARMHKKISDLIKSNSLFVDAQTAKWEIKLKEILSQSFENIEYEFLIKNNSNKELLDMLLPLHEKHTQTFTYERLVSGLDNA